MKLVHSRADVRRFVAVERAAGRRIGLVPTMGFLHEGHLSLLNRARGAGADFVVLSIYVNPLQFGPTEDLAEYPRDLERDAELARARSVDLLFAPPDAEMYPAGEPVVQVTPGRLADRLCGAFRPGHFQGVLTVVAKLLHLVQPDVAVFGQKDFQQAVLIRRMVGDLDFPSHVQVAPIVREPDGRAMSSRNVHLAPAERAQATSLYRSLERAATAYRNGERAPARLRALVRQTLESEPAVRAQYIELVDAETLEPAAEARPGDVLALAAHLGA
ncbi:MAG: pantoate--beta-alanine ligase, partial [Gemmatimonadetes bacterium]|nr:pantoate--beta-alanine ligase [Gemmatimonadota bacterium]